MFETLVDAATRFTSKVGAFLGEGEVASCSSYARKKANDYVSIDFEDLDSSLPFDDYDDGIFLNRKTVGFGFELSSSSGADDSLINSLAEFLKTNIHSNCTCQFVLQKNNRIEHYLNKAMQPIIAKGGLHAKLALKSTEYHLNAAKSGYQNNANIPAYLANYQVFVFFSYPRSEGALEKVKTERELITADLKVIGFNHIPLNQKDIACFTQSFLSPAVELSSVTSTDMPAYTPENTLLEVHTDAIEIEHLLANGQKKEHVITNLGLSGMPDQFALWSSPDLYSNLYKLQKAIACPFVISFIIKGDNQFKASQKSKAKAASLAKNNNSIQNFMNPHLQSELSDWMAVSDGASKGDTFLYSTLYNLTLFSDKGCERKDVTQAVSCYQELGFKLTVSHGVQWLRYLATIPFNAPSLLTGLSKMKELRTLTHDNVANLLPVVADSKCSSTGLLMPTFRNQISCINTFDDKNLPLSNYNYVTCGESGSGKSMLENDRIYSGWASGEQVFVIDVGGSYKHLCELVGGVYVDAATIRLNPFTLFDFDGEVEINGEMVDSYIQIRDLIAVMASPSTPLCSISLEYLLTAVLKAWKDNRSKSSIGDVVCHLKSMHANEHCGDDRLKDLITLLHKYTIGGIYGHIFNGDTPSYTEADFVVFELGSLEQNKELMTIVMFVMIVIIQGQFYHSDRTRYKRCVIDEAWRYICDGDNEIASRFIAQGFRTARKHNGGFGVITQTAGDLDATSQGTAIKSSSSILHTMYQSGLELYNVNSI